jgi:glycosyltransferase involved in cell wall biosynthesis
MAPRELWLFDDAGTLGGGQLLALRLARFASERGSPPIKIVCPTGTALAERCRAAGAEHVAIGELPPLGALAAPRWPRAIQEVRSILRRAGPQAVAVGNSARTQAYLCAAAPLVRNRPSIVQLLVEQDTLHRRSGRFGYRHVGSLVAVGENVAAACRQLLPGVPVWKANNILDPSEIPDTVRRRSSGDATLGVTTRLIPEKGVLELLSELAPIPGWDRLLIAGDAADPAHTAEIEARVGTLDLGGRVTLLGFVDDIPSFLDSIDALVVPSTGREGQPNVLIEALAAGLPCIVRRHVWSTDFEGLPVLKYNNSGELRRCLTQLPLDPADPEELRRRFRPAQALQAIAAAAEGAR